MCLLGSLTSSILASSFLLLVAPLKSLPCSSKYDLRFPVAQYSSMRETWNWQKKIYFYKYKFFKTIRINRYKKLENCSMKNIILTWLITPSTMFTVIPCKLTMFSWYVPTFHIVLASSRSDESSSSGCNLEGECPPFLWFVVKWFVFIAIFHL